MLLPYATNLLLLQLTDKQQEQDDNDNKVWKDRGGGEEEGERSRGGRRFAAEKASQLLMFAENPLRVSRRVNAILEMRKLALREIIVGRDGDCGAICFKAFCSTSLPAPQPRLGEAGTPRLRR